jgi:hypothetical protein
MSALTQATRDVLQVCRNGHVITDLLRSHPERGATHCDRCGAETLSTCPTCGQSLPGANHVAGLEPIGARRAPANCDLCGAPFPWAAQPRAAEGGQLDLERLLRRLPRVVRELAVRQAVGRPGFRIEDESDLEDLLRGFLPIVSDTVRPECRTPRYAERTRTDFLLPRDGMAVVAKLARLGVTTAELLEQLREDADYYRRERPCRVVYAYIHDPAGLLRDVGVVENACRSLDDSVEVRCVVGQEGAVS